MGKSLTHRELNEMLAGDNPPVVIDVRREEAFRDAGDMLPEAVRIPPDDIAMSCERFTGRTVVVYCVHGHEVSQGACDALLSGGIDAFYLEGGIEGWKEAGLPVVAQRRSDAR